MLCWRLTQTIVGRYVLQHSRRQFSSTTQRQGTLSSTIDACCSATHDTLIALHDATGLSWALTLPLAALLVRTTFVLPLDIWSRRNRNKTVLARPLLSAWRPIIQKRIYQENSQYGPHVTHKLFLQAMRSKRKELYGRLGIRTSAGYAPLLQLPVFLIAVETIRRMCGTSEGLLGLLAKSVSSGDAPMLDGEGAPAVDAAIQVVDTNIEPSMATEGALWFPNLLSADPQLVLPFALSAALFTNIHLNKRQLAREGIEPSKWSERFTRSLQLVALAIGPATLSVPSALLVYWLSSSTSAIAVNLMLAKTMPRPLSVKPASSRRNKRFI